MGEEQKSIILNGVKLPIKSSVIWRRVTPFPNQFMTTAPQESDYTPTRKHKWGNLKGGLGKDKWDPQNNDRYSEATTIDASQELQTLGPLVTPLGSFGVEPVKIIKFKGRIWAIGHNKIAYWDGSAWQDAEQGGNPYGIPNPTDAIVFYGTV